jgi:Carboxypeptidase regulatory-like domain
MFRLGLTTVALFFLVWAPAGLAQGKKSKADPTRSVQGTVSTAADVGVKGAVVQLKNVKTLQIRSFITQENGAYYFHELNPDHEYELTAEDQKSGTASPTKKLSSFDTQKVATINLKLGPKK